MFWAFCPRPYCRFAGVLVSSWYPGGPTGRPLTWDLCWLGEGGSRKPPPPGLVTVSWRCCLSWPPPVILALLLLRCCKLFWTIRRAASFDEDPGDLHSASTRCQSVSSWYLEINCNMFLYELCCDPSGWCEGSTYLGCVAFGQCLHATVVVAWYLPVK